MDQNFEKASRHQLLLATAFRRILFSIAAFSFVLLGADANASDALEPFAGNWKGGGELVNENGRSEQVRCRVDLKLLPHLGEATQSMRCVSTANEVMIRTTVTLDGPALNGVWRETSKGFQGTVVGRVSDRKTRITMTGPHVDASLTSTLGENGQSVSVEGKLGKIRGMQIQLRRTGQ